MSRSRGASIISTLDRVGRLRGRPTGIEVGVEVGFEVGLRLEVDGAAVAARVGTDIRNGMIGVLDGAHCGVLGRWMTFGRQGSELQHHGLFRTPG